MKQPRQSKSHARKQSFVFALFSFTLCCSCFHENSDSGFQFLKFPLLVTATPSPAIQLGTTLVAVRFDDGVVLAADARTSAGEYVSHRHAHKIVRITDTTALCRSGSAHFTQILSHNTQRIVDAYHRQYDHKLSTKEIAHLLRKQVYELRGQADHLVAGFLVAGVDTVQNQWAKDDCSSLSTKTAKPLIYSISPSGALILEESGFAASGSGSAFILGWLDDQQQQLQLQQQQDCIITVELTEEQAVEVCQKAIELAMRRDNRSGGWIRLWVIKSTGIRATTIVPYASSNEERANQSSNHTVQPTSKTIRLPGFAEPADNPNIV
jgi:20S proteasome subunit beta 1